MSSANFIFLLAISVLISAIKCTKTPDNYGEGICQYPDCNNPQIPPPTVYQPYGTPPPPKPTTAPPPAITEYQPYGAPPPPKRNPYPPPPVATGYQPYGAPPPPAACQEYCPPPPGAEGQCCEQPDSPPSPPPNPYTYLNESSAAANICSSLILFLFPFLSFLHV